jgi:hypothetical protein
MYSAFPKTIVSATRKDKTADGGPIKKNRKRDLIVEVISRT